MKKKSFCLMLMLVITGAASVNAQVLIGGTASDEPHAGSILDLASGGQNNLGMLLPNVALTNDASEFVLVPEGTVTGDIKQTATGMLVYNTAGVPSGPGLYVWNGTSWMSLSNTCPSTVNDPDGNEYFTGWFGDAGCWMTQNLRYKGDLSIDDYYYPGSPNNSQEDNEALLESHKEYGLLYTWEKELNGICPNGWHVPGIDEWEALINEVSNDASNKYSTLSGTGEPGTKMKRPLGINNRNYKGASKPADSGGFDILLVGTATIGYGNSNWGETTALLANDEDEYIYTSYRDSPDMYKGQKTWYRYTMFGSVRCKKN
jgi:uncharacterized protein (TIGR02145 family)